MPLPNPSSPPSSTKSCPGTTSRPKPSAPVVLAWCHEFYNTARRHSSVAMMTPADYEHAAAQRADGKEAADEHTNPAG
jgi:hypothetical protein